ncbi:hypothetical protein POSPLADRAFT_1040879 [Postia placenta MAD-698-R-SB12]|uniref:Uncharacterized protein n=1 Tax=Postia placenta MAD-698-R-SB12 TaxID=670580 RepID=A0A1X6MUY6_9APHY|nr:hypothetical protein POSPLADRAFT_1040879 [Postia placenta MAD-698-R-SB12]OSX60046.1 hypothetical protein POSPLADRAFT_1067046 [Postia placenta MAD-698-R-SB12]
MASEPAVSVPWGIMLSSARNCVNDSNRPSPIIGVLMAAATSSSQQPRAEEWKKR